MMHSVQTASMTVTTKALDLKEKIIFGSGDIFIGGTQVIMAFYYLRFLTDVIQITPALAGTIVLISKIWDAISDPMMGVITDNTRTRWGRRKPFFFIAFFGIISSFVLLWYPVEFDSIPMKFIYVLMTYLYFSTVSTIALVPYSSMSSEITTDYKERNNVNGIRLFFSQFSSLIGAVLPLTVVNMFDDESMGWLVMAIVFSTVYAIPYMLMFFFTHERVPICGEKSKFELQAFLRPFKIKSFQKLVLMYFLAYLTMDVVAAVFQYYMLYFLDRKDEADYVIGTLLVVQLFLIPVVVILANKYSKSIVYKYSILVWLVGAIMLASYQQDWPPYAIYLISALMGCGVTGCVVMPWAIFPDVTDVGELHYGHRISGSFSGVMTFTRKFSGAFGIFIVGIVLEIAGYLPPVKEVINGKLSISIQVQPDAVITALQLIVLVFPLVLLIPAFFAARSYPLDQATHEKLRHHLEFKRGEREHDNLSEQELAIMKEQLI